jgi:hypothetical protein
MTLVMTVSLTSSKIVGDKGGSQLRLVETLSKIIHKLAGQDYERKMNVLYSLFGKG